VKGTLATVIVNNFNYAHFLPQAVESALRQTYPHTEVIVVDDGSTDDSREVIARYEGQIVPVLKENGGQTSTFNRGFAESRGHLICFLDADDVLLPTALERAVQRFEDDGVVKVHWPLCIVDDTGRWTGRTKPRHALIEGDLRHVIVRDGPDSSAWVPTSGNAWARTFLESVLPIPETERQHGIGSASADAYLSMLAPLFGSVARLTEPQACYRVHGANDHSCMEFERRLARDLRLFRHRGDVLIHYCEEKGLDVDPAVWDRNCWFRRLERALGEIASVVPPDDSFILIDNNQWMAGDTVAGRRRLFLQRDGQDWGPPPNDAVAIRELERLRRAGATFLVIAWPAFWWLEYYTGWAQHLSGFACVLKTGCVVVFDLRNDAHTNQSQ
jgi:glycosyltransferase involved in cell wall biosynthesis